MGKKNGRSAAANTLARGMGLPRHVRSQPGWAYHHAAKYLDLPAAWVPRGTIAGWRLVCLAAKQIRYWEEQDRIRKLPQPKRFARILTLKR